MALDLTFGEVEALLAQINDIASDKRATFQSRIKNLMKLGLLQNVRRGRGKTASYDAASIATFALAVELTQLDLAPERLVRILGDVRLIGMHLSGALKSLAARGWREARNKGFHQSQSYFFGLDPEALRPLANFSEIAGTLSGTGGIKSSHRRWISVNLSVLLDDVAEALTDRGSEFLDDLGRWLDENPEAKFGKTIRGQIDSVRNFLDDRKDDDE